jgi:DNA-binding NtrC family response regulator
MDILIVDDEGNLRRMLRALLEEEGYAIREAASAEEGLEELAKEAPEAVLLDLMLPGISGLEALPRIIDICPGIPVVMMSGKATLGDAVQAARLGAFHFIEKPLTPEAAAGLETSPGPSRRRSAPRRSWWEGLPESIGYGR